MSNMVRKRLEPCQKSLQRLSDIALWGEKKEKWKIKGNQIWEKITAHTEIPSVPTAQVGNERSVSRANRTKQDRQFHNID